MKDELIKVRIEADQKILIVESAERQGISTSEMIRELALKEAKKK